MKASESDAPRVRRITIDERLDEGLIRIAEAELLPGWGELSGDPLDAWSDECSRLISREDFLDTFELSGSDALLGVLAGLPSSESDDGVRVGAFWRSLEEGQVFLVGEMKADREDPKSPGAIRARSGASTVLRIDRTENVKSEHETLYTKALTERKSDHGHPDRR